MNLFTMFANLGQGIADSALMHQYRTDPKLRRRAQKRADECTPCAAEAYVGRLNETFSSSLNGLPEKSGRKKKRG